MAFSGKITAANHADLLAKVTNFITGDPGTPGRDWTVARQDSLTWGPATVFRNTGLSGSEEVYVGLCAATYTRRREGRACLQGLQGLRQRAGRNGVSGYGLRQRDGAERDPCLPALLECRHERLDLEQQGARRDRG